MRRFRIKKSRAAAGEHATPRWDPADLKIVMLYALVTVLPSR